MVIEDVNSCVLLIGDSHGGWLGGECYVAALLLHLLPAIVTQKKAGAVSSEDLYADKSNSFVAC